MTLLRVGLRVFCILGLLSTVALAQQLIIASDVPGAEVYVNSELAGVIPASTGEIVLNLTAGTHRIQVSSPIFVPPPETIELSVGEIARREFLYNTLTRMPGDVDPRLVGSVLVRGNVPNARVFINDEPLGVLDEAGEFRLEGISPGRYDVRLTAPNYADQTGGVTVFPAEVATLVLEQPQTATGALRILSGIQTGQVFLNGVLVGDIEAGELRVEGIDVGSYTMRIEAPDVRALEQVIQINRDQTTTYDLGR
ncbi:MAG: PEGA domain-containing protein [Deinococcota bacterium]